MAMTKEQQGLFAKLTRLQQRVVTGFIAGKSQRQSYLDAKGKAKDPDAAASEILKMPKVKDFIASVRAAPVNAAVMTREEALAVLSGIARTSASDFVEIVSKRTQGRYGRKVQQVLLREEAFLDPEKTSAICEVVQTSDGARIKTLSRTQAIQQLARMQGWEAAQKFDLTGHILTTDVPLTDAQLAVLDKTLEGDV